MTTMDCADIKALLSSLIDDEVDPETRHLTERHISGCSSCRSLMNEAESLDRLIALDGELPFDQLPVGFEDSVLLRRQMPGDYRQHEQSNEAGKPFA